MEKLRFEDMPQLLVRLVDEVRNLKHQVQNFEPREVSNPVMNRKQVAEFLGVSTGTVDNWTREGLIPVNHVGRRKLYHKNDVLAVLINHQKNQSHGK